ncbi:hypothetical protein QR680_011339 [Steinernema hermaphroditum]|uniref:TRUD domain-containing protein n=1 Tax=Steinernema hermaphroditum TaxID=289476 RepID=A0AA39ITC5_9BILA|nr:hypothetical protein QR680_011339 [Steinernema hermaphroditum]
METSFHITNYVNNGWSPLQCVIKKLYSDFTVQEITEAGEVVPLRSVEEAEKSFKEFTQKATKSSDVAVPKEVPAPPVITDEICVLFDSLMTKSIENVVVDCAGLDKAERKGVHEYIRNNYGGNLDSSTSGDNIVVTSSKNIPRNRKRAMWPDSLPDYVHFTMAKEFKDSHFALETLSKYLHINSNRFATAGTKDRRAITTQRVSVYRTEPDKLHKLNKNLRGIRLYDYSYESEPLKLGNLQGNRFTIVLRDLVMPEGTCEDLKAHITERIEQWKESGFINYFGTQRFGTCGVSTAEVGKLILKSDYEGAVNLLLSGMNNTGEGSGGRTIENSVKQHLEKNAKDFKGAIMRIPRSTRSMYAHAYQSAVFNKVVSRRVDKHGTSALPGDVTLNATSPTSFNVRMPLPSHDVIYPENEVSEWYHKTLEEDGVTRQDFAAVAKEFAIGSVFRHAFVKPQNVEYSFKEGYEPHEHLMPDLEHYPECCPIDKSRRPGDDGNTAATKPSLALVITFSLPPGSYATVALRELIRSDLGKEAMKSAASS